MRKVPYLEWENILLDTSIIFAYMQAMRPGNTDTRCDFVKRLVDDLNTNKSTNKKRRKFYISAVSIAEMYNKSDDVKKTNKVVTALNIHDMTFVSFDTDIAEHMTSSYHAVLGKEKIKDLVKEISWPESDLNLAKEWISKDLMIIATADYLKCDVVLTLDEKTFEPVAKKVDCFCCVAKEENFNLSPAYIFAHKY